MGLFYNEKRKEEKPLIIESEGEMFDFDAVNYENIISKNTVITGDVVTRDNIYVAGGLKGDLHTVKNVKLTGIQKGNIKGKNVEFMNGKITGNVSSLGDTKLDNNSIVIGDLEIGSMESAGKIKGNIEAVDSVSLTESAVILGDIRTRNINIDAGAMIKGSVEVIRDAEISDNMFKIEETFMNVDDLINSKK
ncbi:MAG: polymer-forming cytoskeletal protein [Erysipelotrichaceae bacterium]